ncbi:hypothetical protein [Roseomonas indoligenes]|uniref:Uncharacterized protein n=1 Tax=Roseomonas indoligenes TaxID=2820811 RepID=A0A940S8T2_9PROT|nr:hypothetical protein [Pararoseomonas indoligenes]MBP0496424.1 hypothetical protein [Pararoseomonas indoligenes]
MAQRIADRVDALLDTVLALKRELAVAGNRVAASSPDYVRAIAAAPERLGAQPLVQPYEEIAPGLTVGFRQGARPDLHLRADPTRGVEISLKQRTASTWVTLEMEWDPAALREKQRATLLLRGSAPQPLSLTCLLRCTGPGGANADLPGKAIELGPQPGFHAVEFVGPAGAAAWEGLQGCRVIVFCPLTPFLMTLTELSLI